MTCCRWHYLLETQLSQEELEFPLLGEMLFHGPSVDVSSTANISVPPWKQVDLKTTFQWKKLKTSLLPFAISFRSPTTKMVTSTGLRVDSWEDYQGCTCILKTTFLLSNENIIPEMVRDYNNLFRIFCKFILHLPSRQEWNNRRCSMFCFFLWSKSKPWECFPLI